MTGTHIFILSSAVTIYGALMGFAWALCRAAAKGDDNGR